MPQRSTEEIEQRKAAGVKMNRLNCGWNISAEDTAHIAIALDKWEPQTEVEKRDKHICTLAFINNMNASQIARLNDPLIIGMGNRSRGLPLSAHSILAICYKYFPETANRTGKQSNAAERRNDLWKQRQRGEIDKPKVCSTCGNADNLELHHIIPLAIGGTNDYYNMIYLCHDCHMKLHHTIYKKFLNE